MYIYHLKNGINTLSKNGNIPELFPKKLSYEQFKIELEWIYVKFLDTIFRDFLILRPLHI